MVNKKKYNSNDRPLELKKLLQKNKFDCIIVDGGEEQDSLIIKSQEMGLNKCPLCKINERTEKSHIIPKFIGRDIRKRSKTVFLRNKNGKRDSLPKFILMCRECEQKISKFEKYFADTFYHPVRNEKSKEKISPEDQFLLDYYISNKMIQDYLDLAGKYGIGSIKYDINLLQFLISLSWRILVLEIIHSQYNGEEIPNYMLEIEENWGYFLLEKENHYLNFHYLILNTIISDENLSQEFMQWKESTKLNWDIISQKSISFGFSSEKNEFIFCNIPGFLLISTLKVREIRGYENTKIFLNGNYKLNHQIDMAEFDIIKFLSKKYQDIFTPYE